MSFPFPTATIPELPTNTTPPNTVLFEISNSSVSENTSLQNIIDTAGLELKAEKGAVNGYAGLDASQELLLTNFPSGTALQVLRRNAANTALEFTTLVAAAQTPWTSDIDAAGFALLDTNYIEADDGKTTLYPTTGAIRLKDASAIIWRDATSGTAGIQMDDNVISFPGVTSYTIGGTVNMQSFGLNADFIQVFSGIDFASSGITSVTDIEMEAAGFLYLDGGSSKWITGSASDVDINAATGGAINLRINNGIEYFFNATQFNVGNKLIKAVLTPVDGTDAATKSYVDNLVNGLSWKNPARLATTGNITLSGNQTIDGFLTVTGDRILVKDQTSGQFNGVYNADAGVWTRTTDTDSESDLINMSIYITAGTTQEDTSWVLTTDPPIVVDTTVLDYAQVGAGAGNPLTTKGDIFGYDTGGARIPVGINNEFLMADSADSLGVSYSLVNDVNVAAGKFDNIQSVATDFQILTDSQTSNLVLEKNSTVPGTGTISSIQSWDDDSNNNRIRFARINTTAVNITSGAWAASMAFQMYGPLGFSAFMIMNNGNDGDLSVLADINMFDNAIIFTSNGTPPATNLQAIYRSGSTLNLNADAGDAVTIRAGGTVMANFGNGAIPSLQMAAASIQQEIGTAAASNNFMSLVRDGNYYHITGTTSINNITTAGWQSGSMIELIFDGILTVIDAATGSGEIILADSTNYVTAVGDVLTFILDGAQWIEVARSRPGITNIVEDTTPELGGNLDALGFGIDNANYIEFSATTAEPAGTNVYMVRAGTSCIINAPSGGQIRLENNQTNPVLFDGSGVNFNGHLLTLGIFSTGNSVSTGFSYNAGVKQTFSPNGTNAGINIGSNAGEPSTPANGDMVYDTNAAAGDEFKARINGAWVSLGAGGGTGDVSGPASSLNHSLAVFDGVTGKIIDEAGSSGFEVIIDVAGQPTWPRNTIYTSFAVAPPGPTVGFIGNYSNGMTINGNSLVTLHTQNVARLTANSTDIIVNDLNVRIGTAYFGLEEITTPAAPVAATAQLYVKDVGARSHLFIQDDVGEVDLQLGGGGDVTGPGSSTDNEIAIYDSTTGKIIQNNGSGAQPITIDDNANIAGIRSEQFVNSAVFPAPTVPYTQYGNSGTGTFDLENNVPTGSEHSWHVNGTQEYNMTATDFFIFTNNIIQTTGYYQMQATTAPASSGSALVGRLYQDTGNSNHLTISRNGVPVDLEAGGEVLTWTADHSAARFNLENTGAIDFHLSGPLVTPAATQPYIMYDTVPTPDGMKINVPAAREIALTFANVREYDFTTAEFDVHGNGINNVSIFTSNAATPATTGVIRLGSTEEITWKGTGNNSIHFNGSNVFTIEITNGLDYQFSETEFSVGGNTITNAASLGFGTTGVSQGVAINNIWTTTAGMFFNAPANDSFTYSMNGVTEYTLSNAAFTIAEANNIVLGTTTGTKIGTATTQKIGFYNATPIVQPTALTAQDTTITFTAPGAPDFAIQDLTTTTPFGFVTSDEAQTTLQVIANLQTRVQELEDKLQSLGFIA